MDEQGFHARRRAEREEHYARKNHLQVAASEPLPLQEGEFSPPTSPTTAEESVKVELPKPEGETGYATQNYRPPGFVPSEWVQATEKPGFEVQGASDPVGPSKDDPEKEKKLDAGHGGRVGRMNPHLAVMCGPMLKYDTVEVEKNLWHGFAMIVTSDTGSVYDPHPNIKLQWGGGLVGGAVKVEAEGNAHAATAGNGNGAENGHSAPDGAEERTVPGQKIFIYHSTTGAHSFWRFKFEIPLTAEEKPVRYCVNGGHWFQFWVPGIGQNMRWMGHSCNGFSSGVDTKAFNGPDPLWNDVLKEHKKTPLHAVVGGGDQIYCDPLAREPELSDWIASKDDKWKVKAPLTDEIAFALDRFFFNHYCTWFRSGAFGKTIAWQVFTPHGPMLNILDDHDLIDGWGSYPDDLQSSPVFSRIGARGYFWYLLFQNFTVDEVDGTPAEPGKHPYKSMIICGESPFIPFPGHSFLTYLGPQVYIVLLDCRAERKKDKICSQLTYDRVFSQVKALPSTVKHLVMLLGVPIAYPRMNFLESALDSSFNPLVTLGKVGALGLSGFVNKFNHQAELLDDLNDHWTASGHKQERNWLVLECEKLARERHLRISFLSGDVHCAAVGKFFDLKTKESSKDPKFMLNVITSAIVNTPPPAAVIKLVGTLSKKKHKTLHKQRTDERMVDVFKTDTDDKPLTPPYFMARRNYALVVHNQQTGDLEFELKVEISQGSGTTKGYTVKSPAPLW